MSVESVKRLRAMQDTLITLVERKLAIAGQNLSAKELYSMAMTISELISLWKAEVSETPDTS